MITVKVKQDLRGLNALEKHVPINVDKTTKEVADDIASIIHDSWSESAPSSPGNPPAVVTGRLDRSVKVERQGRAAGGQFSSGANSFLWVLHIGAPYAGTLEHGGGNIAPRPFVLPAVLQVADSLEERYREVFDIRW